MNAFLASPFAAQPAALLVGLLLAWLVMRLGRGAFPLRLFGAAMSIGAVMGTLILFLETPFELHANPHGFSPFTIAFVFAGLPEEAAKMIGVYFLLRPYYLNRNSHDLVLAAASLALGFALLENMLYISAAGENWGRLALTRALTAVPFHMFLGLSGGYAIARADLSASRLGRWPRILAAWAGLGILHAAYDLSLFLLKGEAAAPPVVGRVANGLGLAPATMLYALMLGALAVICVMALVSLWRLDRPPFLRIERATNRAAETRSVRVLLSRGAGVVAAVALIAPSLIALVISGAFAYLVDQGFALLWVAVGAVCPIAAGVMLLAFPPSPPFKRMPLAWRRGLGWGSVLAAGLALFAVERWGQQPFRDMLAASQTVRGVESDLKGDHEAAIRAYDRALANNPDFIDALAKRGAANANLEKFDLALADFDQAILLRPDNPELLFQRSEIHRNLHQAWAVIADLDRAIEIAPTSSSLWAARAQAHMEVRDIAKAQSDIAQSERLGPRDPMMLRVMSVLLLEHGDIEGAMQALDADLQANPNDAAALFSRGRLWLYQQEPGKAAMDFERSGQVLTFLYPSLWRFLAGARLGEDPAPELATKLSVATDAKWPLPVARYYLGKITAAEARAAATTDDERCEADFYAAEWMLEQGKTEPARPGLETAAEECPVDFIEYEGARAELRRLDHEAKAAAAAAAK